MLTNELILRHCEICSRPDHGVDRCPHAISKRYPCPYDPGRAERRDRLRRMGL
jgi:hypothetical protein